jgi:hypothetical protein
MDGSIYVKASPSASLGDIALAIGGENYPSVTCGMSKWEKTHECLISHEEVSRTVYYKDESGFDYFKIYTSLPKNETSISSNFEDYSSNYNTSMLTITDLKKLLEEES